MFLLMQDKVVASIKIEPKLIEPGTQDADYKTI